MSRSLILESVGEEAVRVVATLTEGETVIGREPDTGIALPFTAISREHGKFQRVRNHWFYQDLGSTNGSWLNGEALKGFEWRLVRSGDYLQLADKAVRIRDGEAGGVELGFHRGSGRSLIVFSSGQFRDEFPVPEFGRALVIGGAQGDIAIQGDLFENPALVVERRTNGVCAFSVEPQHGTTLNGEELGRTRELKDRDILKVREHVVIFNDPPVISRGGVGAGFSPSSGSPTGLKSWGSTAEGGSSSFGNLGSPETVGSSPGDAFSIEASSIGGGPSGPALTRPAGILPEFGEDSSVKRRPTLSSQFGRISDDAEIGHNETVAIDSSRFGEGYRGADHHPSARYSYDETNDYSFSSMEDRVTIFVGIFLLILLFVLVIWWVFLV